MTKRYDRHGGLNGRSSVFLPVAVILCSGLFAPLVGAQEKPRYHWNTTPPFSITNGTFRQNVCDRHDRLFQAGGGAELGDALRGMEIRPVININQYFSLTDEGAIDEDNPGIIADILDELASRGGFTWRNSFGVLEDPGEGRTWTEMLVWATGQYDVAVDWWMTTTERMELGVTYPEGWYDSSIILAGVEKNEGRSETNLWAWLAPFDSTVWMLTLVTLIVSGLVFWGLERLDPRRQRKRVGDHKRSLKSIFYSMITFTGHLQHLPRTDIEGVLFFVGILLYAHDVRVYCQSGVFLGGKEHSRNRD